MPGYLKVILNIESENFRQFSMNAYPIIGTLIEDPLASCLPITQSNLIIQYYREAARQHQPALYPLLGGWVSGFRGSILISERGL